MRVLEDLTHAAICAAQQPGEFYEMQTDIILLLKQALAAQQGSFQAILSGETTLTCESPACPDMAWCENVRCEWTPA